MARHFLAASRMRDLNDDEITLLSDREAYQWFANLRWNLEGQQVCPTCGVVGKHYWRKHRNNWRCKQKGCEREFSATSGTIFADHKLPIKKILKAIFIYVCQTKGVAAHELCRLINVDVKTAWLLLSKVREMFYKTRETSQMCGVVHADGAYFAGKRRDPNNRWKDPQLHAEGVQNVVYETYGAAPTGRQKRARQFLPGGADNERRKRNRRVVMSARQVGPARGVGATKTRVTILLGEHESGVIPFLTKSVQPGSVIMTDESPAYNSLNAKFIHKSVLHKERYVDLEGTNNNQAESFNSRMRRAEYGTYHGYRKTYLMLYACEIAWNEDHRRKTLRERYKSIFTAIGRAGLSDYFRGYFQGTRLKKELLSM